MYVGWRAGIRPEVSCCDPIPGCSREQIAIPRKLCVVSGAEAVGVNDGVAEGPQHIVSNAEADDVLPLYPHGSALAGDRAEYRSRAWRHIEVHELAHSGPPWPWQLSGCARGIEALDAERDPLAA